MQRKKAADQQVRSATEMPAGALCVNISNALVTAAQSLTLAEKRVMMYAVAMLDTFKPDGGAPLGVVKLCARDYAEQFDVDDNTAYGQLRSASKGIFNRYIRFFEHGRKGPEEVTVRWVSSARYSPGAGSVTLRFTAEVAPHLINLQRQFTSYKLAQASALRSIYSWRVLELISQYKDTGWLQIDIDKFHFAIESTEKQRNDFAATRRKIIEPAVKELTQKDGWKISWSPIKEGRKVVALRFEFARDPQGRLPL